MRFSVKAILAEYQRRDGTYAIWIRAIINRQPAKINLGFSIKKELFDCDKGLVKPEVPDADLMNYQILDFLTRANKIFLQYRFREQFLSPAAFRKEFIDPAETIDFVKFMEREMEARKPKVSKVTHGAHATILAKIKKFQSRILFGELTIELIQRFENTLINNHLKQNTIHKIFRVIKVYLHEAERKEIRFKNPFLHYKVKSIAPQKPTLSFDELKRLFKYYSGARIPASHHKALRYFLFSCTTGVRISDIGLLEWNHLHGDTLVFLPYKTRRRNRFTTIPLATLQLNLIGGKKESKYLFDCYAKAVTNRLLKEIAKVEEVKINKHLTYHISRHTFATEFLNQGGMLDTLQQLLGHSMITTTMQYNHVKEERKMTELTRAFEGLNDTAIPVETTPSN
jgi:integrase/recombinase XerD